MKKIFLLLLLSYLILTTEAGMKIKLKKLLKKLILIKALSGSKKIIVLPIPFAMGGLSKMMSGGGGGGGGYGMMKGYNFGGGGMGGWDSMDFGGMGGFGMNYGGGGMCGGCGKGMSMMSGGGGWD